MNLTCNRMQEDWELYALGSLDEEQQREMNAHLLSGCRECAQRYSEAQAAVSAMARLAPQVKPSARVEAKLRERLRMDLAPVREPRRGFWTFAPWALAAACLLAVAWLGMQWKSAELRAGQAQGTIQRLNEQALQAAQPAPPNQVSNSNPPVQPAADARKLEQLRQESERRQQELAARVDDLMRQVQDAQSAKAQTEHELANLHAQLAAAQQSSDALEKQLREAKAQDAGRDSQQVLMLKAELAKSQAQARNLSAAAASGERLRDLLQAGNLQQVDLRGVDPGAGKATARAIYSPQGGLLLVANSLPELSNRKCYQLWIVRQGDPAILSAGLVQLENDGRGFLYAPPSAELRQLTALAITDEPAGGSVSARGHKLLFGTPSGAQTR